MSKDKIQMKKIKKKHNVLKILYYDDKVYMIPYTRTESDEIEAAVPEHHKTTVVIFRSVLEYRTIASNGTMRVALEEKTSENGVAFSLTAEVEYDHISFCTFTANKRLEDEFFNIFVGEYMIHLKNIQTHDLFQFQPMDILKFGSRDFKELNKAYTSVSEMIVHKYDGYKCKFFVGPNGRLTYCDAKNNLCHGTCDQLASYKNIVFQGEVMPGNNIVITDILGGFVSEIPSLYMPQPQEIYIFFDFLRQHAIEPFKMMLFNKPTVQFDVYLQKVIRNEEPPLFQTDGYIIIQHAHIFKFKRPTLDVIVENGYLKVTGLAEPISDEQFNHLEDGGIYEVCQTKDGTAYKVLRRRFDRRAPCDSNQLTKYLVELNFMRKCVRASTNESALKDLGEINNKVQRHCGDVKNIKV
nr:LEF-4 [Menippe mercenaria nudivirus]